MDNLPIIILGYHWHIIDIIISKTVFVRNMIFDIKKSFLDKMMQCYKFLSFLQMVLSQ